MKRHLLVIFFIIELTASVCKSKKKLFDYLYKPVTKQKTDKIFHDVQQVQAPADKFTQEYRGVRETSNYSK